MKWTLIFIVLLNVPVCNSQTDKEQLVSVDNDTIKTIQYSEKELISFLDSIGKLYPNNWTKTLLFQVDSTLHGQVNLNNKLNALDFEKLKVAAKSGEIDFDFAKQIFPQAEFDINLISNLDNNTIPISFYSFDKNENDFNEFAISIGLDSGFSWNNDVYFFKANKVIAKHKIFHRYGLELKHFKNETNETIVYYKVNYGSGSGIWWHQFNFYNYNNDKLLPTLTEIKNINLQYPWSIRSYWIESIITNTKPLKLKFVFNNQFTDTLGNQMEFINDSTEVTYNFDRKDKIYKPNFTNSKLNQLSLLTYFLSDNELLFVNTYSDLLKKGINRTDLEMRKVILVYLNKLKTELNK